MGLSRGYQAVDQAAKVFKQQQSQREAARIPEVYLRGNGDKVTFFLNGDEDEPVCVDVHVLKTKWPNGGKDRYVDIICAADDNEEGCVACYSQTKGDKRVSPAQKLFYWSVVDVRFVHKTLDEEKTAKAGGRFEKFTYVDCKSAKLDPNPKVCQSCKLGVLREMRGKSKLKLRATLAEVMKSLHEGAAKMCAGCGVEGELQGFKKGTKILDDVFGRPDADQWKPLYSCETCDEFVPSSLRDCPITMTRTGVGKGTTYTIVAGKSMILPEAIADVSPVDFEPILVSMSADEQAKLLSIRNPFKKGAKGASSYNDAVEEDELPDDPDTTMSEVVGDVAADDLFF